ncbi:MAG: ice-binding family protein [Arthrobacter sp.]
MSGSPLHTPSSRSSTFTKAAGVTAIVCSLALFGSLGGVGAANAATPPVGLGTADSYSVLAGSTVTNVGATTLQGDLGVAPGTAITGFPPGIVGGAIHATDPSALQAQNDLTTAYNDIAGRPTTASLSDSLPGQTLVDLAGQTLVDGVYTAASTLDLSGTLTLDGQGDPLSVFVFQVGSALTTASASNINLINGANACNVYWQVGSSATLGTDSNFKGNLLALTSVSVTTRAVVEGRVLARNGQVSLDTNVFTNPVCAVAPTASASASPSVTASVSASPSASAVPTVSLTAPSAPNAGNPAGSIPGVTSGTSGSIGTTPAPSDSSTQQATETTAPVAGEDSGSGPSGATASELARTGANTSLGAAAIGLLLAGTALLFLPKLSRVRARARH